MGIPVPRNRNIVVVAVHATRRKCETLLPLALSSKTCTKQLCRPTYYIWSGPVWWHQARCERWQTVICWVSMSSLSYLSVKSQQEFITLLTSNLSQWPYYQTKTMCPLNLARVLSCKVKVLCSNSRYRQSTPLSESSDYPIICSTSAPCSFLEIGLHVIVC